MGSNVEIVKSLWPTLRQFLNDDDQARLKSAIVENDDEEGMYLRFRYEALTYLDFHKKNREVELLTNTNLSANHPSPFDYVDEAVLLLWEYWKLAMFRVYNQEDQAWRYQPQQVCFVLSDVWRDGRWLQELMPGQTFGVYVYCWDGFGAWVEPKFLEYGKVRLV